MSKTTIFLTAALVLVLDQLSKRWAVAHLALYSPSVTLVPDILYLTRTNNTGSAFGLFPAATEILAAASLCAAIAIAIYVARRKAPFPVTFGLALALPLGGAIGNFLDRARLSYVVDFIDLRIGSYHWPVFNIADSAICIGVALLAIIFVSHGKTDANGEVPVAEQSDAVPK